MLSVKRTLSLLAVAAAASAAPIAFAGAQSSGTVCNDGSSSSAMGSDACSGHGGVNIKATRRLARVEANTSRRHAHQTNHPKADHPARIVCADGAVLSSGNCAHHGGVLHNPNHPEVAPVHPVDNHPTDNHPVDNHPMENHPANPNHPHDPHADSLHPHHGNH